MIEALCALALLLLLWPMVAPESWPHEWIAQQLGVRPAMWRAALELGGEQPATGLGLGTFFIESARVYPRDYAAHELSSGILETAHSLPLHVVAELGLVGLLLAAWLFLRSLNTARRAGINAGHTDRALLRGAVCGALGMLAQALVSTEIHYAEVSVHVMLAVALIAGFRAAQSPRPVLPRELRPRFRLAAAALVLTLFAAASVPGLLSQLYLHQAETAPTYPQLIRCLRRADRSTWTTPSVLQVYVEKLKNLDQSSDPALAYERTWGVLGALNQVRRIDRLAPNFWITRRLQARLALILGNLDEAADAIVTYARKDPFDPRAYQLWLAILDRAVAEGKPDLARPREAEALLTEAGQQDTKWLPQDLARNFIAQFRRLTPAPSP